MRRLEKKQPKIDRIRLCDTHRYWIWQGSPDESISIAELLLSCAHEFFMNCKPYMKWRKSGEKKRYGGEK